MNIKFTSVILILILTLVFAQYTVANNNKMEFNFDNNKTESTKIYPNPLVDEAVIKLSTDIDFSINKVSIVFYNLLGKEVYKIAQIKDYETKITKENFKFNGVYFYQLKIDERTLSTGKLIVK